MKQISCTISCRVFRDMLTDWALPANFISNNNTQLKDDSLVKLALKKAKAQTLMQNNSKKGKFVMETSLPSLTNFDRYVTTTSIKEGGQTYEISLDCMGRTREVCMWDKIILIMLSKPAAVPLLFTLNHSTHHGSSWLAVFLFIVCHE